MRKIHHDNRVIFWLLIGGIVLNIIWSLRLELQAQNTKTMVDSYHFNLNQKVDTLFDLVEFFRRADEISIKTNNQKMEFYMNPKELGIYAGGSWMKMLPEKELVEIRNRDSFFQVGEAPVGDRILQGIFMGEKNSATLGINKDEGIGLISKKEINISLAESSKTKEGFHFNMSRDKELIEIRHRDSFFQVGEAPVGDTVYQGVFMGEKNSATLGINKDEGIGLLTKKTIKLEAQKELIIEAEGDINISSKNGVVKINGKKILMDKMEEPLPSEKPLQEAKPVTSRPAKETKSMLSGPSKEAEPIPSGSPKASGGITPEDEEENVQQ